MPSTYAHYRFGRLLLERLPEARRARLNAARGLFDLGLHGPDILFFHEPLKKNPVSGEGTAMHDRPARVFFEKAVRQLGTLSGTARAEAEAYICGYICHFSLDAACHTYVERRKRETGVTHTEIECEFDRRLMARDGCPKRFPMAHIVTGVDVAARILPFYENVTQAQIEQALKSMRFYGHLLNLKGAPIRMLAQKISTEIAGWYATGKNPRCDETCEGLLKRFDDGLILAERLFAEFEDVLNGKATLNAVYDRTFGEEENELCISK